MLPRTSFRPGEIWPDTQGVHINAHGGGILHHEGTYYWFGEHKIDGDAGNAAHVGVHVYSSTDLYNWKDEGIALQVVDDPAHDLARGCILERPKVLYNARTKRFVMWFHLELLRRGYTSARVGIAVADRVTGPYQFLRSQRLNAGSWPQNVPEESKHPLSHAELDILGQIKLNGGPVADYPKDLVYRRDFTGGQMSRDMTLFLDDDDTAYHIAASEENGTLHLSQLSDDFLGTSGRYVRIAPGRFNEAPAIMKWQGTYFLFASGCTGWSPNPARLYRARSIWGPWEELFNPCIGSTFVKATTFDSQSTYILPVANKPGAFIFLADRWRPKNAIDGRYVWLPIQFRDDAPAIAWHDEWTLDYFQ